MPKSSKARPKVTGPDKTPKTPGFGAPDSPDSPATTGSAGSGGFWDPGEETTESGETWLLATVSAPPLTSEAVSGVLFEAGSRSVWEDLPDKLGRPVFKGAFSEDDAMRLMAELPPALEAVRDAFSLDPDAIDLSLELVPFEDYVLKARESLEIIVVDESLVVTPKDKSPSEIEDALRSHRGKIPKKDPPANAIPPRETDALVLRLDPGAAFGSGRHPSTFMCLKLLARLKARGFNPKSVLDVGSGSGILSLASALLFPKAEILGIDNDPDTLAVARANLAPNGLKEGKGLSFSGASPRELSPPRDLILANLTLNPILELSKPMAALLAPRGSVLILSGILDEQAPETLEAFRKLGLAPETRLVLAEWSALELVPAKDANATPELPEREILPDPTLETKIPR
ncbi:MAG: 50S ribosomal protein L11 methyltransferase [Deltaproteobacteria bacterium]|jgi:ribosomal protein L11 methylase PrmA|nr:50S ribosomal protein L11 methyltransferase [Deltaproteobacteria bacterium]